MNGVWVPRPTALTTKNATTPRWRIISTPPKRNLSSPSSITKFNAQSTRPLLVGFSGTGSATRLPLGAFSSLSNRAGLDRILLPPREFETRRVARSLSFCLARLFECASPPSPHKLETDSLLIRLCFLSYDFNASASSNCLVLKANVATPTFPSSYVGSTASAASNSSAGIASSSENGSSPTIPSRSGWSLAAVAILVLSLVALP